MKCNADNTSITTDYDSDRMCRYEIKTAKGIKADTIDCPLQVAIVKELYTKTGNEELFYIITNDLELTTKQMREGAHIRWRIENNGFKLLNKLFRTKRKISNDENFINNLLWIIFIAYNCLMLFLDSIDIDNIFKNVKITNQFLIDQIYQSLILSYYLKMIDSG